MVEEQQVDNAYAVLDWLSRNMVKVGDNPQLIGEFFLKFSQNIESLFDAIMTVTAPEHRGAVAEVMKSSARLSVGVLKWMAKK